MAPFEHQLSEAIQKIFHDRYLDVNDCTDCAEGIDRSILLCKTLRSRKKEIRHSDRAALAWYITVQALSDTSQLVQNGF